MKERPLRISFDASNREDYLKGMRKRKAERRLVAHALANRKKRIKKKQARAAYEANLLKDLPQISKDTFSSTAHLPTNESILQSEGQDDIKVKVAPISQNQEDSREQAIALSKELKQLKDSMDDTSMVDDEQTEEPLEKIPAHLYKVGGIEKLNLTPAKLRDMMHKEAAVKKKRQHAKEMGRAYRNSKHNSKGKGKYMKQQLKRKSRVRRKQK
mmetsp:Transcript_7844/g.11640  ORF Transcript_7844/g.11640 Transcript_7844/m.11640 type:complete len:213 (+) Transcript_7844:58-696(+)